MPDGYQTVFEVSYLSNGILLLNGIFLSIGLFVAALVTVIRGRMPEREAQASRQTYRYFLLVAAVWLGVGVIWLGDNLHRGYELTRALRSRYCRVVEGTVEVLHREPYSGHAAGDRIRIAGREFGFSYYSGGLGYSRTIAHGGRLRDGVPARLHYVGTTILKVEVRSPQPSARRTS